VQPKSIVAVLESLSAARDVALTRALGLAHWYGAQLHAVHVDASVGVDSRGGEAVRDRIMERVNAIARSSGVTGVAIVPGILPGRPVRAIADYSNRVGADLVVVGKEVRRSNGYWLAGSFATAIGRAASRPTLAIPDDLPGQDGSGAPFRTILAATDFSVASLRALSKALVLAQQSAGRLTLLHVLAGFPYESVDSGARAFRLLHGVRAQVDRVNRELRSLLPPDASNWADIDVATVSGEAHDAIVEAAAERGADLIVLGVPRRRRLEELVTGSTVHRVVRRTRTPVLLVPGPSAPRLFRPLEEHGSDFERQPVAFPRPAIGQAASSTEVTA
jgi:nucleotide-binding universal stress UspA family protein